MPWSKATTEFPAATVARRFPWSTCPDAADPLRSTAVGVELCASLSGVQRQTRPRLTCTHMYDVFALAVVHANDRRTRTAYDIIVPDRIEGRTRAQLRGPGEGVLEWQVDGDTIEGAPPFGGRPLYGGFVGAEARPGSARPMNRQLRTMRAVEARLKEDDSTWRDGKGDWWRPYVDDSRREERKTCNQ